jgi:DNA-binding beta-propeller fold protein YncE
MTVQRRRRYRVVLSLVLVAFGPAAQAQAPVPPFHQDTSWPKAMPNHWVTGALAGVSVDRHEHVWLLHRASTVKAEAAALPAPPVIEVDKDGTFVRAWGGKSDAFEWLVQEHGLTVDDRDNVWVSGAGRNGLGKIMKFSPAGALLLEIGDQTEGRKPANSDPSVLSRLPADMAVDTGADELFVADGERGNRRVIVFNASTGTFKRMWGAYGEKPDEGGADKTGKAFSDTVHCVKISSDGLVYVCDRANNRLQVFRKDGTFVKEGFVEKHTAGAGSTTAVAFSPDQSVLFVGDGVNQIVWMLDRASLTPKGQIRTDSNIQAIATGAGGDLYVASSAPPRLMKFTFTPRPGNP